MALICVLDDEPVIRFVISEALRDAGCETRDSASGAEVLQWLSDGMAPSAIVLDLLMPGMSGREFLERLRANRDWAHVPVVVVTGATYSNDAFPPDGSYQALVLKPFDLRDLVQSVLQQLRGTQGGCRGRNALDASKRS